MMKNGMRRLTILLLLAALLLTSGCGMQIVRLPQTPITASPRPTEQQSGREPTPTEAPAETEAPVETEAPTEAEVPTETEVPAVRVLPEEEETEAFEEADYRRAKMRFDDFRYERPDFAALSDSISEIYALVEHHASASGVKEAYGELETAIEWVNTQYSLMSLISSLDSGSQECRDELEAVVSGYDKITEELVRLECAIADSEYCDTVFEDWCEADFAYLSKSAALYDAEYTELDTRSNELINDYQEALVTTTVSYRDRQITLAELMKMDDISEQTYYRLLNQYYETFNAKAGELYLEYIRLQKRIAEKAGYENYSDYAYDYVYERDYTPEDAERLWGYVKQHVSPMLNDIYESLTFMEYAALNQLGMGANALNQWTPVIRQYAAEISPDMEEAMQYLIDYDLSILTDDDNSEDGAYTTFFYSYDVPFIYMHENGGYRDAFTFVHEFGHFYAYYLGGEDTADNMSLEISEICSQANELLFMGSLDGQLSQTQYNGLLKYQLYSYLRTLVEGCLYDEFQQYVYANEIHTVEELNEAFLRISKDYGISEDEYAVDLKYIWVDVQHNFVAPLYYISYAAAIVPALEIFDIAESDRAAAIAAYNKIADSEGEVRFEALLRQCGLQNPFAEQTIETIAATAKKLIGAA